MHRQLILGAVAFIALILGSPHLALAQTAEELAKQYNEAAMEQALETKHHFDLYGIHFEVDTATI